MAGGGQVGCDVRKMCVEPADSFTSAEEEEQEEQEEEEEGVGRGKVGSVGVGGRGALPHV